MLHKVEQGPVWTPTPTERWLVAHGIPMGDEHKRALAWARFRRGGLALDVATGSGRMAWVLAQAGHPVVAVDCDAKALNRARYRARGLAPRPAFRRADAAALPFAAGRFDAAACAMGVHHMKDPAAVFAEVLRVVRPGGCVLVMDFNAHGLAWVERSHQERFGVPHEVGVWDVRTIGAWARRHLAASRKLEMRMQTAWTGRVRGGEPWK